MFPPDMQFDFKCERHDACGGYCRTLEQYQFELCEKCMEFDIREVNRQISITRRREELKSIHRNRTAPLPAIVELPLKNSWRKFESVVRFIVKK
ncbi:MAG: hypothetical protein Q7K26_01985 [bacterium]|nr:hypothetical protein [bacterium]